MIREFLRILLKKNKDGNDYMNFWLILFHGTTIQREFERHPEYKDDNLSFYSKYTVKNWQYKIWERWVYIAVKRQRREFFIERRPALRKNQILWLSWWTVSRYQIRNSWLIWLNLAPTVKDETWKK